MPVINIQPREKLDHFSQDFLEVHSIFDTIQGEGPFAGRAAVFVRLAGCNLQCPGCDTDYTGNRAKMATPEIVMEVNSMVSQRRETNVTPPLVVITGGEPLRQNITLLCEMLVTAGCQVQLETNGVLPPPPGLLDICTAEEYLCFPANVPRILHRESGLFIVVSPKTHRINSQIASYASAYKYVVNEEQGTDGLPNVALENRTNGPLARPPEWWRGPVYVQPQDEQDEARNRRNLDTAMALCRKHGYILQVQLHKIIGVE
jgi:organic radical activating enzyme